VGDRLGISRERVRQLEVRALRRMRMALETETKKVA
jgi:DNA-directed RNA polymerase sigma subunit (sigma70/sigma32)